VELTAIGGIVLRLLPSFKLIVKVTVPWLTGAFPAFTELTWPARRTVLALPYSNGAGDPTLIWVAAFVTTMRGPPDELLEAKLPRPIYSAVTR